MNATIGPNVPCEPEREIMLEEYSDPADFQKVPPLVISIFQDVVLKKPTSPKSLRVHFQAVTYICYYEPSKCLRPQRIRITIAEPLH